LLDAFNPFARPGCDFIRALTDQLSMKPVGEVGSWVGISHEISVRCPLHV